MIGFLGVRCQAAIVPPQADWDSFGQRYSFRFQVTPVIPGLIKNPLFGK